MLKMKWISHLKIKYKGCAYYPPSESPAGDSDDTTTYYLESPVGDSDGTRLLPSYNPLQSHWNLAKQPEDYLYSSAMFYEKAIQNLVRISHYMEFI